MGVAVAARRPVGGRKILVDVFGGTDDEAVQAGTRRAVDVLAAERNSASEQLCPRYVSCVGLIGRCRLSVSRFFWINSCHLASAVAERYHRNASDRGLALLNARKGSASTLFTGPMNEDRPGSPLLNDVDGARPGRRIVDREPTSNQDGISGRL